MVVTQLRAMTYKLLGVYVSNDLKWNHHVQVIVQKGNRRLYSLTVLKQCGAPPASLAKVYTTIARPVQERIKGTVKASLIHTLFQR